LQQIYSFLEARQSRYIVAYKPLSKLGEWSLFVINYDGVIQNKDVSPTWAGHLKLLKIKGGSQSFSIRECGMLKAQ